MSQLSAGGIIPPALSALMGSGLTDRTEFNVTLPFPEQFLTSLIKGTSPMAGGASLASFVSTAVSATSGWQIYCSSTIQSMGGLLDLGTMTGYLLGPTPKNTSGEYQPNAFFLSKIKNLDPNNTGKPDAALKAAVNKTPDQIGVDTFNDYQKVLKYGGFLFSGKLYVSQAQVDPVSWIQSSLSPVNIWTKVPNIPARITISELMKSTEYMAQITEYINGIKNWLFKTDEWGNLNFFIPGPEALLEDPQAGYIHGFAESSGNDLQDESRRFVDTRFSSRYQYPSYGWLQRSGNVVRDSHGCSRCASCLTEFISYGEDCTASPGKFNHSYFKVC
jgi:hypothetical protein